MIAWIASRDYTTRRAPHYLPDLYLVEGFRAIARKKMRAS